MESYYMIDHKLVKVTKWMKFKRLIHDWVNRFKLVDTWKYKLIPHTDSKYYFKLSSKEYENAEKIYDEGNTISYEFYPIGGIAWGVRVKILESGEVIDISDTESW